MEAGHQTFLIVQGPQGVNAALKAYIEVQIRCIGGVLLEQRQRDVMTGADGQQLVSLIPRLRLP